MSLIDEEVIRNTNAELLRSRSQKAISREDLEVLYITINRCKDCADSGSYSCYIDDINQPFPDKVVKILENKGFKVTGGCEQNGQPWQRVSWDD